MDKRLLISIAIAASPAVTFVAVWTMTSATGLGILETSQPINSSVRASVPNGNVDSPPVNHPQTSRPADSRPSFQNKRFSEPGLSLEETPSALESKGRIGAWEVPKSSDVTAHLDGDVVKLAGRGFSLSFFANPPKQAMAEAERAVFVDAVNANVEGADWEALQKREGPYRALQIKVTKVKLNSGAKKVLSRSSPTNAVILQWKENNSVEGYGWFGTDALCHVVGGHCESEAALRRAAYCYFSLEYKPAKAR